MQGKDASQSGFYYQNNENSWTKSTTTKIDPAANYKSKPIKIGNTIYWQSTNKGLWTSTDNGATWTQSTSEAALSGIGGQVNEINQVYYLGTNKGYYTSIDGVTWTQNATAILNNAPVAPGKITKINSLYYVASATRALWAKEF